MNKLYRIDRFIKHGTVEGFQLPIEKMQNQNLHWQNESICLIKSSLKKSSNDIQNDICSFLFAHAIFNSIFFLLNAFFALHDS